MLLSSRGRRATAPLCLAALAVTQLAAAQRAPPPPRAAWWKYATLRAAGGVARITGARDDPFTTWTLDLHAGLRAFDTHPTHGYWIFGGDVGASIGPRGGASAEVLWLGGPSVSYGAFWFTAGWAPRFVAGELAQGAAVGVRNTLSACMFMGFACVDASHQWLSVGDGSQHDLRLAFGLDLGMLAQVIIQFARARPG